MTTVVAVAFPDESTAGAAAEDLRWAALDVIADADAVAVVSRDRAGSLHLTTSHGGSDESRWGVFWVLLVETLLQNRTSDRPAGSDGGRSRRRGDAASEDPFRRHLRDMLAPGTSVLFLAVEYALSDEAVRELTRLGGILVTWGLTADGARLLRSARCGMEASGGSGRLWPADDGVSSIDAAYPSSEPLVRPFGTCGSV